MSITSTKQDLLHRKAEQGDRKSKSAMKKHDKAIEKNGWLLLGYEEVLGNLRQEHADTL